MWINRSHVVQFSGGAGSWAASKLLVERNGWVPLLLFCDTMIEDDDLYRFLIESAANIGGVPVPDVFPLNLPPVHEDTMPARREALKALAAVVNEALPFMRWIYEGRDVWQVFNDRKYLGNSRRDPCSHHLKRDLADKWFSSQFKPDQITRYVGIDIWEEHRFIRLRERIKPWIVKAPLCEETDKPFLDKPAILRWLGDEGLELPLLYRLGFSHNNCGGFCCKAGKGQFTKLLQVLPDTYAYHERQEEAIRGRLGPVTILKETIRGEVHYISLRELRERIQAGEQFDDTDQGGCGCMIDTPEDQPVAWEAG